MIFGKQNA